MLAHTHIVRISLARAAQRDRTHNRACVGWSCAPRTERRGQAINKFTTDLQGKHNEGTRLEREYVKYARTAAEMLDRHHQGVDFNPHSNWPLLGTKANRTCKKVSLVHTVAVVANLSASGPLLRSRSCRLFIAVQGSRIPLFAVAVGWETVTAYSDHAASSSLSLPGSASSSKPSPRRKNS